MKKVFCLMVLLFMAVPVYAAGLFLSGSASDYLYNKSPFTVGGYTLRFTGYTALDDNEGFGTALLQGKIRVGDTAYSFSQACRYSLYDNSFIVLTIEGSKIPGIKMSDQMSFLFVLTFDGRLTQISGMMDEPILLLPEGWSVK